MISAAEEHEEPEDRQRQQQHLHDLDDHQHQDQVPPLVAGRPRRTTPGRRRVVDQLAAGLGERGLGAGAEQERVVDVVVGAVHLLGQPDEQEADRQRREEQHHEPERADGRGCRRPATSRC